MHFWQAAYVASSSIIHLSDTGNLPNTCFIVLTQRTMNGNRIYDAVTQQAATWFSVHDAVTMMKETAGITEVLKKNTNVIFKFHFKVLDFLIFWDIRN